MAAGNFLYMKSFTFSVESSCNKFMDNKKIVQGDALPHMPWPSVLSDHLLRYGTFEGTASNPTVRIGTWNTLNPAYQNWLKPRYQEGTNVDLSQRLWWMFDPKVNDTKTRIREIASIVCDKVQNGYVMCLQEVGMELYEEIRNIYNNINPNIKENLMMFTSREETEDDGSKNLNLVLFDNRFYVLINEWRIDVPELKSPEDTLQVLLLEVKPGTVVGKSEPFCVVNVHVSWKKNKQYSDQFKKLFGKGKQFEQLTFICGDFNCSARNPDRKNGVDHFDDFYADGSFGVLDCSGGANGPLYSHVNTFENAKSTYDQVDCFDYILVKNFVDGKV